MLGWRARPTRSTSKTPWASRRSRLRWGGATGQRVGRRPDSGPAARLHGGILLIMQLQADRRHGKILAQEQHSRRSTRLDVACLDGNNPKTIRVGNGSSCESRGGSPRVHVREVSRRLAGTSRFTSRPSESSDHHRYSGMAREAARAAESFMRSDPTPEMPIRKPALDLLADDRGPCRRCSRAPQSSSPTHGCESSPRRGTSARCITRITWQALPPEIGSDRTAPS